LLESRGVEFDVVHYLQDPPDRQTLTDLVARLSEEPANLVRKDSKFKSLGLDPDDYTTAEAVVELLSEHIGLMQRPLIDDGERVFIGRPPSTVQRWLDRR